VDSLPFTRATVVALRLLLLSSSNFPFFWGLFWKICQRSSRLPNTTEVVVVLATTTDLLFNNTSCLQQGNAVAAVSSNLLDGFHYGRRIFLVIFAWLRFASRKHCLFCDFLERQFVPNFFSLEDSILAIKLRWSIVGIRNSMEQIWPFAHQKT